jgi:hypothetical protein
MPGVTRRTFNKETLGSLLTLSLLETVFERDAFAKELKPLAANWLTEVNQISRDMRGKKITQVQWQEQVEKLMDQADIQDLLKFLDFEKLTKDVKYKDHGERSLRPKFPEIEGLPKELVYGTQLFALKRGRSVVPHGHMNMATAFIVCKGEFHGRHYDKLEDNDETMVIRPTIDKKFGPGGYSSISDDKDNVHWFKTISDTGFIFNIHVYNVIRRKGIKTGRVYIDPDGEQLSTGRILAKKIGSQEAHEKYG